MRQLSILAALAVFMLLVSSPIAIHAKPVYPWRLNEIASKADILVTGEVVEITTLKAIDKAHSFWRIPILHLKAKIRVLRAFSKPHHTNLQKDQTFALEYNAIDWKNIRIGVTDGPAFPGLDVARVYVFPLYQTGPPTATPVQENWKLISEKYGVQDKTDGLLVPGIKGVTPNIPIKHGFDFLMAELAGTFVLGNAGDIEHAAYYLDQMAGAPYLDHIKGAAKFDIRPLFDLVARQVGTDTTRWAMITADSYGGTNSSPGTKLATLRSNPKPQQLRPPQAFLALALRHLHFPEDDALLIGEILHYMDIDPYNAAQLLTDNYAQNPATIQGVSAALNNNDPMALLTATMMIKDKDNPNFLTPPALKAALRYEQDSTSFHFAANQPQSYKDGVLREAVRLIFHYGSDADFNGLFNDVKKAQRADRVRYKSLWLACLDYSSNNLKRAIPICRLAIDDTTPFEDLPTSSTLPIRPGRLRLCDDAAFYLQCVTGVDFGLKTGSIVASDIAVSKAKAWLLQHPNP